MFFGFLGEGESERISGKKRPRMDAKRKGREQARKQKRATKRKKLKNEEKRYHICRAMKWAGKGTKRTVQMGKNRAKMGIWNTRGLGVPKSKDDMALKTQCIFEKMDTRGWGVGLLGDEAYGCEEGYRTIKTRRGGKWKDQAPRCMIKIPSEGKSKGYKIVALYAPTSNSKEPERDHLRGQINKMLEETGGYCTTIVGGDFNAEVGKMDSEDVQEILGPEGNTRRTKAGKEWLQWCAEHGLLVAHTFTPGGNKTTWWLHRYGTEHILDMILMSQEDRAALISCKAIHEGRGERISRKGRTRRACREEKRGLQNGKGNYTGECTQTMHQ